MSRRIVVSIAAALVLAPLTALAADGAPSSRMSCECSHTPAKPAAASAANANTAPASAATAKTAPVNSYQGVSQADLDRIWGYP